MTHTLILRLLAACTTLTAVAMAAVSALDRGGSLADKALLVALSTIICFGAHLLLALSRRKIAVVLWAGCIGLALVQHMSFFTHAGARANQARAETSAHISDLARQREDLTTALASISARPVAEIASELSQTKASSQRRALIAELEESRRAAGLRDQLVTLSATVTDARVTESQDPVTLRLSAVTDSNEDGINVGISLLFAVILELTGSLLWLEALSNGRNSASKIEARAGGIETSSVTRNSEPVTPVTTHGQTSAQEAGRATGEATEAATGYAPQDELEQLRQAVAAGLCEPSARSVLAYLKSVRPGGCGQARASDLRARLKAAHPELFA
jgi:hypothetical protein